MAARLSLLALASATFAVGIVLGLGILLPGRPRPNVQTAAVVPPYAALYLEVLTRPHGTEGDLARRVLAQELGGPPLQRLGPALAKAIAPGAGLDYARDVRPWLGGRVGLFYLALAGARSHPTLLIASRRDAQARIVLARAGTAVAAYRGTQYRLRRDGAAVAIVDHVVVVGPEPGVRAAIDASHDGSLSDTDAYRFEVSALERSRLGLGYLDVGRAAAAIPDGLLPASLRRVLVERLAGSHPSPLVGALTAAPGALVLDLQSSASQLSVGAPPPVAGGAISKAGSSAPVATAAPQASRLPVVSTLPSDTVVGIGVESIGAVLAGAFDSTSQPPGVAQGVWALRDRLGRALGLSPSRDLFPWMHDAALMVRAPRHGDAALVVTSLDPSASARAARALRAALSPLLVLPRRERLVLATSRAAALDALSAPVRLAARREFDVAVSALGSAFTPLAFVDAAALRQRSHGVLRALFDHVAAIVLATKGHHDRVTFALR